MNKDVEQTCKEILSEIGMARRFTEVKTYHELFISAETIISQLAFLLGPLMDAEVAFLKKVREYNEGGLSVAAAEVKAKTEEEYLWWKKIKGTYELADSQILLIKKFADKLQGEFIRS